MAALIVYFSRAGENYFGGSFRRISVGNTERAAQILAELTGAEQFRLEPLRPYPASYDACVAQAVEEKERSARPELKRYPEGLERYEVIYLGYPNYCGTMPMPVFTFLEHCDLSGKQICPFCTHEGSGMGASEADLRRMCPGAAVTRGLAIHGSHAAEAAPAFRRWLAEMA